MNRGSINIVKCTQNSLCLAMSGQTCAIVSIECLDHILILNERQFHRMIKEYVTYFNTARPHRGIGHRVPLPPAGLDSPQSNGDKITAFPVLGACIMTTADTLRVSFLPQMSQVAPTTVEITVIMRRFLLLRSRLIFIFTTGLTRLFNRIYGNQCNTRVAQPAEQAI